MNTLTSIITLAIILAVGVLLVFVFRFYDPFGFGLSKAKRAFPEIAEALGLEFTAPESESGTGELKGEYKDYYVLVSPPNDPSGLSLKMHAPVDIELSMEPGSGSGAPAGMTTFDFPDNSLNTLFRTRFASGVLVDKLVSSSRLPGFAESFTSHWGDRISRLECSNGYIYTRFKYGLENYIPPNEVRPMLDDLVVLAGILGSL